MKNRKLTKNIRKLILLLLALVVLFPVLSGCQSSTPPSQESSYAPLSDEKITEIKKAWETQWIDSYGSNCPFKWDLTSEVYYFGTHRNCIAILDIHLEDGIVGNNGMSYEVAGVTIYSLYDYYFFIYRNGTFVWLKEAYEKGWVTKEHIISMAERLKNQYPDKVEVIIDEEK